MPDVTEIQNDAVCLVPHLTWEAHQGKWLLVRHVNGKLVELGVHIKGSSQWVVVVVEEDCLR
jgi:hypothetical protein